MPCLGRPASCRGPGPGIRNVGAASAAEGSKPHEAGAATSSGAVRAASDAKPVVRGTTSIRPSVATGLRTISCATSWVDAMPESEPHEYRDTARRLARMRRLAAGTAEVAEVDAVVADLRVVHRRQPRLQLEFDRARMP